MRTFQLFHGILADQPNFKGVIDQFLTTSNEVLTLLPTQEISPFFSSNKN